PTKKTGYMGPSGNTGIWVPSRPQRLSGCVGPSRGSTRSHSTNPRLHRWGARACPKGRARAIHTVGTVSGIVSCRVSALISWYGSLPGRSKLIRRVGPSQELVAWVPRAVRCGSLCARGRPRLDDVHVRGGHQPLAGARTPSIVQVC